MDLLRDLFSINTATAILITCSAALVIFTATKIWNFFFVNPRIQILSPTMWMSGNPVKGGVSNYRYRVFMKIENHSPNIAFGLSVLSVTFKDERINSSFKKDLESETLESGQSTEIIFYFNVDWQFESSYSNKDSRLDELNKELLVEINFTNKAGRAVVSDIKSEIYELKNNSFVV